MNKVLILTKTNWQEAPRLRHQITRLLSKKEFDIHFVEKNTYLKLKILKRQEEGISFYKHPELIHHQLRYHSFIQNCNNRIVKYYLKKLFKNETFDYIINFNYDYVFLKELFPRSVIVSFINDDFESMAKWKMKSQIREQLANTCTSSNHVITVSYPLLDKLKQFNKNTSLIFPWAKNNYVQPKITKDRKTVLYFGYIGRLNWSIIDALVSQTQYNFRFIGPCSGKVETKKIKDLTERNSNFNHISFVHLKDLDTSDVFCSILPYDENIESNQACTISNRALNLLALGLPLAYANLKYLIKAPNTIIRKNTTVQDYINSLDFFHSNFDRIQGDINIFMEGHYEENRWSQLKEILSNNKL